MRRRHEMGVMLMYGEELVDVEVLVLGGGGCDVVGEAVANVKVELAEAGVAAGVARQGLAAEIGAFFVGLVFFVD